MGRIHKRRRSSFWWADYTDTNGERVRVSTKTTNKKRAREFLVEHEADVARGIEVLPSAGRTTYEKLRDNLLAYYRVSGKWKDMDEAARRISYLSRPPLGGFQPGFGGLRVGSITPAAIRLYCQFRLSEQVPVPHLSVPHSRTTSPATVNRELSFLRRMLRLGAAEGLVNRVPRIEMLREAAPRKGFVDDSQFGELSEKLRRDLRVVVSIAYKLGWRVKSEILTMRRAQVSLDDGTVRLDPGTTKNREGRLAYLTPDLTVMLAEQITRVVQLEKELKRPVDYVFPYLSGRLKGRRIESFRKEWSRACRAAGLHGLLVHDLRRSAVRNMERVGVPRSVAMKVTGHKTESVYRRYSIVSDADLKDAMRRMNGTVLGTLAVSVKDSGVEVIDR